MSWSTLNCRPQITASPEKVPPVIVGRPFNLMTAEELKIVSYITKM
jgi:hypothetical protein